MYCCLLATLIFIVHSYLRFSEKFTMEFSAFRLALDISGGGETGEIIMWSDNGGDNQKWNFDDDMTIRSGTGSVLEVKDGSMENSAPLVATSKENQNSQKFRIVPVME
jgi:hypothetical protein